MCRAPSISVWNGDVWPSGHKWPRWRKGASPAGHGGQFFSPVFDLFHSFGRVDNVATNLNCWKWKIGVRRLTAVYLANGRVLVPVDFFIWPSFGWKKNEKVRPMTHARLLLMTLTLTDLTDGLGWPWRSALFLFLPFWLIDAAWTSHLPADFSRFIYSTSPVWLREEIYFRDPLPRVWQWHSFPVLWHLLTPAGHRARCWIASQHGRCSFQFPKMQRVNLIGPKQQQPTDKRQPTACRCLSPAETRGNIAGH